MENNAVEPKETQKRRGQTKEHMAEISKIGNDTKKKKGAITAYDKAQKRKEIDEKFAMIQAEISKSTTQKDVDEVPEPPPPVIKKTPTESASRKPKKIVEIIEEEEDQDASDEDEEEEIVVKRIIKKKTKNEDKFIQKSNIEMLKNRFNEDVRKRLMSSLFD